ncbi:MAG: D domain of beta-TrCP [Marteilia pararefringens]
MEKEIIKIFSNLSLTDLCKCELVSMKWKGIINKLNIWYHVFKKLIKEDKCFGQMVNISQCITPELELSMNNGEVCKLLIQNILSNFAIMEQNWKYSKFIKYSISIDNIVDNNREFEMPRNPKGIYCFQIKKNLLFVGLRNSCAMILEIQDNETHTKPLKLLSGHKKSILSLEVKDNLLFTSSSDTTIRCWDIETGECLNVLKEHSESVLQIKVCNDKLVSASSSRHLFIWKIHSGDRIVCKKKIFAHSSSVNVVECDNKFIITGGAEGTIHIWDIETYEHLKSLMGHTHGISSLDYSYPYILSGSMDKTIRIWNIEGICIRILKGSDTLIRCLKFNTNYIVSGSYNGEIRLWNFKATLDSKYSDEECLVRIFICHNGKKVFRLHIDDFRIVSSGQDQTLNIWDYCSPELMNFYVPKINK